MRAIHLSKPETFWQSQTAKDVEIPQDAMEHCMMLPASSSHGSLRKQYLFSNEIIYRIFPFLLTITHSKYNLFKVAVP